MTLGDVVTLNCVLAKSTKYVVWFTYLSGFVRSALDGIGTSSYIVVYVYLCHMVNFGS